METGVFRLLVDDNYKDFLQVSPVTYMPRPVYLRGLLGDCLNVFRRAHESAHERQTNFIHQIIG